MKTWIEDLSQTLAEKAASRTDSEDRNLERNLREDRRRLGIDERVKRILNNLPETMQGQPMQVAYFVERMGAKWKPGGRAHSGEIGGALTRLGWTRRRAWNSATFAGRYPQVWYPPGAELPPPGRKGRPPKSHKPSAA